jgi:uncharacterized protein
MVITPTYPGVYVEELPSGVHTITGVATSITAFIGKTSRGPANQATTITSYADFERQFGGLSTASSLSYAVRDFFLNGGSQAIIVRLTGQGGATATLTVDSLTLQAVSGGAWGNALRARVDYKTNNPSDGKLFNLYIKDTSTGQIEVFLNVSVDPSNVRRVDNVLKNDSQLVQFPASGSLPASAPAKSNDPTKSNQDPWGDNTPPTNYKSNGDGVDGNALTYQNDFSPQNAQSQKIGLYALEQVDLFNLLNIPPYESTTDGYDVEDNLLTDAAAYCASRRAMLIVDAPSKWNSVAKAVGQFGDTSQGIAEIANAVAPNGANAAVFFPRLQKADPLLGNQIGTFAPGGTIAGIFAATDAQRGVWKAPAGIQAALAGVVSLSVTMTNNENGELNPLGVNCIRTFTGIGTVVWGSRTIDGNDILTSQWKYIPVRRTALFIEESLYRGLQWVVFEPNDEPLWAQIRLNVTSFMQDLFRKGAFQGSTPKQAYLVKCDSETTTQTDIDNGIVNIIVGFAPLKPAEFVILQIEQLAGQTQS